MLFKSSYLRFALRRRWDLSPKFSLAQEQRNVRSLSAVTFAKLCSEPTSKFQIYSSLSHNPFFNLSVEHFLLQKTPVDSTVLLFYVNRPCVVIGRNQNPWLEADLKYMALNPIAVSDSALDEGNPAEYYVELVRRRSGGGTVFHDFQNVNYSVIRPSSEFTRDRSVEMVVSAIREDNPRARVNERHDIVLDTGPSIEDKDFPNPSDMHTTRFAPSAARNGKSLKVSGSAYKLTRNRSLHHGTCLLNSSNLQVISRYLNSPARPFISAKGVDSVRSPVSNLYGVGEPTNYRPRFETQVLNAFLADCHIDLDIDVFNEERRTSRLQAEDGWVAATFNESLADIPQLKAGMEELMSPEWLYGQTPRFSVTTQPSESSSPIAFELPNLPAGIYINLIARSGVIQSSEIKLDDSILKVSTHATELNNKLQGLNIHEVDDFTTLLPREMIVGLEKLRGVTQFLNAIFGINAS